MNILLKWIWTFPIGIALIFILPNWSFIGIAIMAFGLIAFFVDSIRSHKRVITPMGNEIIVKVTWILLPSGTKSPFRFNGWTDVGQTTMGTLSAITNELTVPATGGVIKTIKLAKGINEVQTIINSDGSRLVTLITIPSKLELWFARYLGMASGNNESRLNEDINTPQIIHQGGKVT